MLQPCTMFSYVSTVTECSYTYNLLQASEATNLVVTGCGVLVMSVAGGQCQRGVGRKITHGTGVVATVLDMVYEPQVVHLCLVVYLAG